ncbi:fimbrillin family protein [Segatella copri]|uniref:fimbrillin family protein n=1 Tax=Segatella copri TaxID=165179 RepID=UPI0022313CB7|nr:fimbrillin family protein [Segatella copri]MCW4147418.1 fimbrillin family protein [Segatella copri]
MDKKFFMGIAAMAALTLVSCSSDDLDSFSDNSSKNEAISFDGYLGRSAVAVNGTRGSEETKETLKTKGFGVFGNYIADAGQTSDANFFKNQKVTYSGTKWTYTPLKYWPTNGKINFLAYAPHKEGQELKANTTTFDFTVADKAANQIDLLWANATGQIKTNFEGTTKEKVKFLFKHALSRLGYTVKLSGKYSPDNATFTLRKITLAGSPDEETKGAFYKTGTIDLSKTDTKENLSKTNTATGLWTAATDNNKQNFTWFDGTYNVTASASHPDEANKNKDYLFVIPQNFSEKIEEAGHQKENPDKLYVIVEYDVTYTSSHTTITNKVYKKLPIDLMQGKAYMLNLTIGLPIEFDIDVETVSGVEPWEEVNDVPGNIDSWDDINH